MGGGQESEVIDVSVSDIDLSINRSSIKSHDTSCVNFYNSNDNIEGKHGQSMSRPSFAEEGTDKKLRDDPVQESAQDEMEPEIDDMDLKG